MGLDEWGAVVIEKTRAREAREAVQAANRVKSLEELEAEGLQDNNELHDAAVMRARRFEDWADGVPKGSGNTKRI